MQTPEKKRRGCLGKLLCGMLAGILILVFGIVALRILTEPGKAPPHPFDSFTRSGEISYKVFSGGIDSSYFDHIWVLASPDLQAWWYPNGMRAEADLIIDSDDPALIREAVAAAAPRADQEGHARLLPEGRIYHVLLFNTKRREYAHLRFEYRAGHKDGSVVFCLVTEFDGAKPVKDCPGFVEFEKQRIEPKLGK